MFAPNLKPKLNALAILETVSINTNNGTKAKSHPDGTNKSKYFQPFLIKPNNVIPNHIVKLKLIVNTNCAVIA